tara:strand:+ start:4171 stop:5145 length:975 start_codon:yes stop_codon:yes gene_type:complete
MQIREVLNDAKSGLIHPVYYLKGSDYFLQSFVIEKISNFFFNNEPIAKHFLHPDDLSQKEILDKLTTSDLFMTKQMFIILKPHRITGNARKDLIELCFNPIENHLIFIINDDFSRRNSFFLKIESNIDPIDVQSPFSNEMKKWANYLIKKKGKQADFQVINLIVEIAGDSVGHLENEIEKLSIQIGERKIIQKKDLEKYSGWKKERKLWEFLLAFGEKNYSKSIFLGKTLLKNNHSMMSLLYPLVAFLQEILFLKMGNGTFNNFNGYILLPPSVKRKLSYFSKKFEEHDIKSGLIILNDIDKRIKSQNIDDETELIQFINNVIG